MTIDITPAKHRWDGISVIGTSSSTRAHSRRPHDRVRGRAIVRHIVDSRDPVVAEAQVRSSGAADAKAVVPRAAQADDRD
jgi:hypothetical protein